MLVNLRFLVWQRGGAELVASIGLDGRDQLQRATGSVAPILTGRYRA